jgi:uncharacterized protein (TIGR00266 family)
MQYQILKEPMAMIETQLDNGEQITSEAGAMVYIKGDIEIKTRTRQGGFFKKLKVSALGGQSFFVNDYIAHEDGCIIGLTGPPIGDIIKISITGGSDAGLIVHSGAYIASTLGVVLDTDWQGFTKGIFGSELFMLKVTGQGDLFLNAYGGIIHKQLIEGEKITLSNYHLVALSETANYKITKFGGLKSTLLGGQGLVVEIVGPGSVYFQTKNIRQFIDSLGIRVGEGQAGSTYDTSSSESGRISFGDFKFEI